MRPIGCLSAACQKAWTHSSALGLCAKWRRNGADSGLVFALAQIGGGQNWRLQHRQASAAPESIIHYAQTIGSTVQTNCSLPALFRRKLRPNLATPSNSSARQRPHSGCNHATSKRSVRGRERDGESERASEREAGANKLIELNSACLLLLLLRRPIIRASLLAKLKLRLPANSLAANSILAPPLAHHASPMTALRWQTRGHLPASANK